MSAGDGVPQLFGIRLEVEHVKQTIRNAVVDHFGEVKAMIEAAIEEVCTPERLKAEIAKQVAKEADIAIRDAVQRAIRYAVYEPISQVVADAASRAANEYMAKIREAK